VSKLFLPLTVITAAFATIKGIIDGWKEDGFVGALKGAITGLGSTLIAVPLDLVKDLVSWVSKKLGFDSFSETLDSFSFQDLYEKFVGAYFDSLKNVLTWVKSIFTNPKEALQALWEGFLGAGIGIVNLLWNPIKSAIDWIKGKFDDFIASLSNKWDVLVGAGKNLMNMIWSPIESAVNWIKGIFADPLGSLKTLWQNSLGTYKSLLDIIFYPVNKAISWISGLFGWEDGKDFSLTNLIWGAVDKAINWVTGLFGFKETDEEESWSVTSIVSGVWDSVKTWFTSKFSWKAITDEWAGVTSIVSGVWDSVKTWFTSKFGFNTEDSEEGEQFSIKKLFDDLIERLKNFFSELFDFLPSLDDIKSSITSMLPSFMQPASIEEQKGELKKKIAEAEEAAAAALPKSEKWVDLPGINDTREDFEAEAAKLREQLSELEKLNRGGIVTSPDSGGLAVLHGTEAVIPLDSPKSTDMLREALGSKVEVSSSKSLSDYNNALEMMKRDMEERSRTRESQQAQSPVIINQNIQNQSGGGTSSPVGPLTTRPTTSRLDDMILGIP
jgi:hypothetical protein